MSRDYDLESIKGFLGRVTVKDVGYVNVTDPETFRIAQQYMKVLAMKLGILE